MSTFTSGGNRSAANNNDENSTRLLVQDCLRGDEYTPLLRLLFTRNEALPTNTDDISHAAMSKQASGSSGAAAKGAEKRAPLDSIRAALKAVAVEQEVVVREVCGDNALEIAQCVSELEGVHGLVGGIRKGLTKGSDALQAAGATVQEGSAELGSLVSALQHIGQASAACHRMQVLLDMCLQVGRLVEERRLYHALQLVQHISKHHVGPLTALLLGPAAVSSMTTQHPLAQPTIAPLNTAADHSHPESGMSSSTSHAVPHSAATAAMHVRGTSRKEEQDARRLVAYLSQLVGELHALVEYRAVSEFNDWLVAVRAEARASGMCAIRTAAIQRQLEEGLAGERKLVGGGLAVGRDAHAISAQLLSELFRKELQHSFEEAGSGRAISNISATAAKPSGPLSSCAEGAKEAGRSGRSCRASGADVSAVGATNSPEAYNLHPGEPQQAVSELLQQWRTSRQSLTAAKHGAGEVVKGTVGGSSAAALVLDDSVPVLLGLDMRGLYRCVHIQGAVGQLPAFRAYYLEQRRLQITTDLTPPSRFMESYQAYLSQVAGFFLVEHAVQSLVRGLASATHVAQLWEGASSSLKATLEVQLGAVTSAPILLLLKEFVLLVCDVLEGCGCSAAPLQEVLIGSRGLYHELLMASTASQLATDLSADTLTAMVLSSQAKVHEAVEELGLPGRVNGGAGSLSVPLSAPFSSSLPALLTHVRGFVSDSLAFLRGLYSPWELLQAVFHHRDRFIGKVLVDALTTKVVMASRGGSLQECMQMVVNVWCIVQALDTLDEWTITLVRPISAAYASATPAEGSQAEAHNDLPSNRAAASGSKEQTRYKALRAAISSSSTDIGFTSGGAGSALRGVQDAAERCVLRLATQRVDSIMEGARAINWLPAGPLHEGSSPYVAELIAYLQHTFGMATSILPRASFLFLCRTVVKAIGFSFMKLFSPEQGIKAYNLFAIEQLSADLAAVTMFADTCAVPNLAQEFAESQQLCKLLLSNKVEEVLVPDLRARKYPNLEPSTVLLVLDRYKELAKFGKDKVPTNFPSRRTLDLIAKQLRGQMVLKSTGPKVLEDF